MEALTQGYGTITEKNLKASLASYLGKEVELIGNGPWQYQGEEGAYTITEEGNVAKGWICLYDENGAPEQVTNGELTLNIGDYINYDPGTTATYTSPMGTKQSTATADTEYQTVYKYTDADTSEEKTTTYYCYEASAYQKLLDEGNIEKGNGYSDQKFTAAKAEGRKWKVIGVDSSTGELQIVADDSIKSLADKVLQFEGITGYLNCEEELNKVCAVYGNGEGATGARSITLEDVNKAIGRTTSTTVSKTTLTWTPESKSQKNVSPSYDGGTNYFAYSHLVDGTRTGIFNYFDLTTKKWKTNKVDVDNITENITVGDVISNYHGYGSVTDAQKATKGYEVLFKTANKEEITSDTASSRYWLASPFSTLGGGCASWGVLCVYGSGYVNGNSMYYSFGIVNAPGYGVRPVVSLKSDIQLEAVSGTTDTYDIM